MEITRNFNLRSLYQFLLRVVSNSQYSIDDRINLYRFLDKLSDSDKFEFTTSQEFKKIKSSEFTTIKLAIENRKLIQLECGFELRPSNITNWDLYHQNTRFLSSLDATTAFKICKDINVAFKIKSSQIDKLRTRIYF